MTSYSIDLKLAQQPHIEPNSKKYELEVDASDWESQMAKLVGFKEESPKVNIDSLEADIESLQPSQFQPEEVPTEQPLSSNPFAKLALVGSGTFAVVLVAGVFLTQIMSTGNQKPKNNLASSTASLPPKIEPREQNLEQEIETLKTKLALAEQVQTVTAAQQNLRTRVVPKLETPRINNRTITPVQTASAPRVVTVERIIENPFSPLPVVSPVAAVPTVAPPTVPLEPKPETQPSPPDPLEEWTKLAKLGSYGQVYTTGQSSVNMAKLSPVNNSNVANQPTQSQPEPTPPEEDILVSQSQNSKSVKVGTSAKAVLVTAVFGETTRPNSNRNNQQDDNQEIFVVRLKEPLKSLDGAIALPANTELLAQISSISERGLLRLDVIKFISQDNDKLQEISLPSNAIIVRAPQGKPLLAGKFPNNGSSIARMDAGLFVLGGVSKAAELLNRVDSEVTTNSGSTIVTNSNSQRNLAAGIVEGGLKSIVPQIAQRNQQAITQMMQNTNVWMIPAGQEVEIYINRTIQF
ncbi:MULTISPECIES: TrbI/VirB10 family protein [unclassified Anabaena]|uniref:TrbI/VirB10 family protein n=1 Tax=unclassified Anabaena TaxID=2619674 RepID=UPI0014483CC1|nr:MULTISPECIES: TrbI/VirB10 family protein [unclassified Anabaena]MTJ09721.1 TrbI/VirB10 family protein [Anabaena sp. UHCC 0204]MTJ54088.1 TrbI/VirB10 family protein [Anabaena sp. UHCC 0253]